MTTNSFPDRPPLLSGLDAMERIFAALGSKNRLILFFHLCQEGGRINVAELTGRMNLAQPTVSHHLGQLRAARLLDLVKHKNNHYYQINRDVHREVLELFLEIEGLLQKESDDPFCQSITSPPDLDSTLLHNERK